MSKTSRKTRRSSAGRPPRAKRKPREQRSKAYRGFARASGALGELANAMIGAGTALLAKADDRVIGLSLCAAAIVSKIAAHLMNPK